MDRTKSTSGVIAAFPATGKTWLTERRPYCVDSDSSRWSRDHDWPENYMRAIDGWLTGEYIRYVFVSTHTEVRAALVERGIPFTLVYPHLDLRDEYAQRLRDRGSPEGMVALIFSKWDRFLAECAFQVGCRHVVLGPGQYLADVIQEAVLDAA